MNDNHLYREFSVTCTKEHLISLSAWLNDNLNFDKGEDFNKLSDSPRAAEAHGQPDDQLCKTDKKTIVHWLDLMADLIPHLPDGNSLVMQNNARRMKLLSKKLQKQLQKSQIK